MSGPAYLIRNRVVRVPPTPIPASTYTPETFAHPPAPEPIKAADPRLDELARPKVDQFQDPPAPVIPRYQNPPPAFKSVDVRANSTVLHRDLYLMHKQANEAAVEEASEPTEFLDWQKKMRDLDEQQRIEVIQKRHEDLDFVRRRAAKVRKERIAERLALGKEMRLQFSQELEHLKAEIEVERQKIRELKGQLVDRAPKAVQKAQRAKIEATRTFRRQIRADWREEQHRRLVEVQKLKTHAEGVRQAAKSHTMTHGDPYSAKLEITQTTFLAALSDEEAAQLVEEHSDETKERIEREIEDHRRIKANKMDKLIQMLDEATAVRNARDDAHVQRRKAKLDEEARVRREREIEEEDKMLQLEKKLERKHRARIREAEEMGEHTRQIAARNRYLALNKKAIATKVFQSQQDAKLRSARERQEMRMPEDQIKIPAAKFRNSQEMPHLRSLLGLK